MTFEKTLAPSTVLRTMTVTASVNTIKPWRGKWSVSLILAGLLALVMGAQGQIPNQINYQGRLTDASGNPAVGSKVMAVRLYDAATNGNRLYEETIGPVTLGLNGVYSFQFGAVGAGIAAALNGPERHLALVLDGVEQVARTRLLAVPFAMKSAQSADAQAMIEDLAAIKAEFRVIGVPTSLDFGQVFVNERITKNLVIRNLGFGKLTVNSITLPTGFGGTWSGVIPGFSEQNVEITYHPTQIGGYAGEITVSSNSGTGLNKIAITGEGVSLPTDFIPVSGGTLPSTSELGALPVSPFYIGKYEVQWGEFQAVRTWAAANGYDIGSAGVGSGSSKPVTSLNWYQALKWCNARSEMEGRTPVYTVNGMVYRSGNLVPDVNQFSFGYRLPFEKEWAWAARGGAQSNGYTYSGSNSVGAVAWYYFNSGNALQTVGGKAPNEIGLYDMSGNASEWCFDSGTGLNRALRGGSFIRVESYCAVSAREFSLPDSTGGNGYGGFRLALSSAP
jgi:sulfatase modifying factor 1